MLHQLSSLESFHVFFSYTVKIVVFPSVIFVFPQNTVVDRGRLKYKASEFSDFFGEKVRTSSFLAEMLLTAFFSDSIVRKEFFVTKSK